MEFTSVLETQVIAEYKQKRRYESKDKETETNMEASHEARRNEVAKATAKISWKYNSKRKMPRQENPE